jgi:hypothetical protein
MISRAPLHEQHASPIFTQERYAILSRLEIAMLTICTMCRSFAIV